MVSNNATGKFVWGRQGKDTATLDGFFDDLGPERSDAIEGARWTWDRPRTSLNGRADQRYCTPACRQAAYRRRTPPTPRPSTPPPPPARRSREHTVYECGDCGERLLGEQWCPDCQRPARRIGPGAPCPSCLGTPSPPPTSPRRPWPKLFTPVMW